MMPAHKQPWYIRLVRYLFPPRKPRHREQPLSEAYREQRESQEYKVILDRYDEAFDRYRKQLAEIRSKRAGRRRE